eukprot:Hpha_TRINITY_DN15340_c0_g1::TRINITY_DN15340_c0_g1_i1::g.88537::m.88537
MHVMRAAVVGLAMALASTEAKTVEELTAEYAAQGNASCAKVVQKTPQLPAADQAAFMAAYKAYDGTDATKMIAAASKVLSDKEVAAFLSPPDSFGPGGFDAALVQCVVVTDATPLALAEFAVQGAAQEASVDALLKDSLLMRDMLLAGGPQDNNYGEAASLYSQILKSSRVLQSSPRVRDAAVWDDRNQSSVLHRLALGTALAFATPKKERFPPQALIDPVKRYLNFEGAYLAGGLDPYFEVLTVFELRWTVPFDGSDDDLDWLRETMYNIRPEHIVIDPFTYGYDWRYSRAVRTDVAYGDSVWPDGVARYRDLPAAGAVCGGRAFFGRFCRRAFGLPTLAFPQTGHGSMITWAYDGWAVLLGAPWQNGWCYDSQGHRSGPDFKLETDTREFRSDFQKVLRGSWAAQAGGETPVSRDWNPTKATSFGTGGNWSALMYAAKVVATQSPAPGRPLGPSVVPTKVAELISIWNVTVPAPSVSVGPDGSITIPAAAVSFVNRSAPVKIERTLDGPKGTQLAHGAGNFADPDSTAFEYTVDSEEEASYYLVANFTTWHVNTDLQVTTNTTKEALDIPTFYTVGHWKETQPVEVTLLKGKNVLRFVRQLGAGLVFKQFFLLKKKPVLPPVPGNYTPAPAPPPLDKYIQLRAGLTCQSQGILDLDDKECGYAAAHFGFKYTGARQRPLQQGCWGITQGEYAGNANLNVNKSAPCCNPDVTALCLRQ